MQGPLLYGKHGYTARHEKSRPFGRVEGVGTADRDDPQLPTSCCTRRVALVNVLPLPLIFFKTRTPRSWRQEDAIFLPTQ